MKKSLLFATAILFAATGSLNAQVPTEVEALNGNWAAMTGSLGMDVSERASINEQGETFVTLCSNTQPEKEWISYMDIKFNGSGISLERNGNPDFVMYKLDKTGKPLMILHSDRGYFDKLSPMVATPDGGALLALHVKRLDRDRIFPQDNGKDHYMFRMYNSLDPNYVYTIEEPNIPKEDGWVFKGYLLKLDKNGKVEWRRDINADSTPVNVNGSNKKCSDMFSMEDVIVGPDGCFYVLGKFARPLNIQGAPKQFIPDNIPADWKYDFIQYPAGDMYLTKFDANGNYKWTMTHKAGSFVKNEGCRRLAADKESVYVVGHVSGTEGQTTTFGDKTLTIPTSDLQHIFYLKVNCKANETATDGNIKVDFAQLIKLAPNALKKKGNKIMCFAAEDDKLIIGGGIQGILYGHDGNELLKNDTKAYHGYAITASAIDGKTLAGTEICYVDNTTNEVEGLHIAGDSLYIAGYSMGHYGWVGALDKETLKTGKVYSTFKGGFCTLQKGLFKDNQITIVGRGQLKPFEIKGIDNTNLNPGTDKKSPDFKAWEVLIANLTLTGINEQGSVESIEKANVLNVYASKGNINIVAAEPCQVNIYSISGMLVKAMDVEAGSTAVEMPQGFYIVNGKKVIVY